jgi:hypothetical protein
VELFCVDNLMMVEINSSEDWVVMDFTFPTKAVESDDDDNFFFAAAASNPALRGAAAGGQQQGEGDGEEKAAAVSGAFACVWDEYECVCMEGRDCVWKGCGVGGAFGVVVDCLNMWAFLDTPLLFISRHQTNRSHRIRSQGWSRSSSWCTSS